MRLGELQRLLPGATLVGDPALELTAVSHDSRRLPPGAAFVAVRGLVHDGNAFVEAALRKGVAAIVSERPAPAGVAVPWLEVADARVALAELAAALHGRPAEKLELVGVTGTNGKTTTAFLIEAALRAAGRRVGLVGTVEYRIDGQPRAAERTTPESSDLQELLAQMVAAGCSHAVLEVSSHSLALERVHGCPFRVAVFTNLTRDHLDFHGDMERYFTAKRRLFDTLLRPDGHAIINADDDHAAELVAASRGRVWTYSRRGRADLTAEAVELSLAGTRLRVRTPAGEVELLTPLVGRFNVENLLAALGAALALGLPLAHSVAGLTAVRGVPGRMERVELGQDFSVVVDYAHTDDALRALLETVRELEPRRVITVFGCGGDRDRTKRPLMGAVAARLSDLVVITSDNPRSEPPEAILEEIRLGIRGPHAAEHRSIVDRREAIAFAVEQARAGDVVVIAGKGHETIQVLRERSVPFDDRAVAREAIARLAGGIKR
jgi:UDP-N-acetylmuramoyl-L-alanyl-D-glutamate--2,6-diaminopimelate ligase